MGVSENEIGLREGRARIGELVNRAQYAGETTYITRHGRRVAAIVPINRIKETTMSNIHRLKIDVTGALGDHASDFDVEGIVEEIGQTYGYDVDLDAIPAGEYNELLERHDKAL